MNELLYQSSPLLLPVLLIVILSIVMEAASKFGIQIVSADKISDDGWNVVQAGVLSLVAFMLGFSFAQAQAHFDERRALVVTEANAIGTTWLRADQLPAQQVPRFRGLLYDYLNLRKTAYQSTLTPQRLNEFRARSDGYQTRLWNIASAALRASPGDLGRSLLMQSLNDTIDDAARQQEALVAHVPTPIVTLTLLLVVLGGMIVGLGFARSGKRPRMLAIVYVLATVIVVDMVVDLDRPESGFVQVDLGPLTAQLDSMR
jgi:hypothetical protein